jgi:pyruvate/2-oxoglutarate dehydrogenase complex dihydrolipoamide dehydrogenase (E3) component
MIASARVAHLARRGADYGVGTSPAWVDLARVRQRKRDIVDSFRNGIERTLATAGVELRMGQGRFTGERTIEITQSDGTRTLTTADVVVLNTGLRPRVPDIPGLADVNARDSTSIMELDAVPEHLIVLGGGYVGLEFAQMFRRFGSRVTLVHQGPQLLQKEDADIAGAIATVLRQDEIDLCLNTDTTSIARTANGRISLTVKSADVSTPLEIVGSHLLVAVGRTPNTDDLGADASGVALDEHGFIRTNARLETTAAGVYAIGDVKGGPAFTHVSYDDFRILRTNLLEKGHASTEDRLLPYTVFIDPQLGRVGMTEVEARKAGFDVRVATMPMSNVARALEVDETRGVMKAIVDRATCRILGAAVLGIEGGEMAAFFQLAMMGGLPYTTLRDAMFSHPTLSESLNNLFARLGD